ncbi:hypothetical protein AA313_de0203650 [Arthrobotrys entomopaga]|nr:hypothetical protein AA313_de0203650 [Arthrobotrys entomopaga]
MSWRSSGSSNSELVENMKRNGLIANKETYEAMMKVDRAHFAPGNAYKDAPQPIGWGATVQPGGRVVGIEHIQELVDLSVSNLRKDPQHSSWLDDGTITIIKGDGRLGYPAKAPYNAIHVGAAAKEVHKDLVEQLSRPGRLFIPVDGERGYGEQSIWHVDKDGDGVVRKEEKVGFLFPFLKYIYMLYYRVCLKFWDALTLGI